MECDAVGRGTARDVLGPGLMLTVAKVTSKAAAGYANYLEGRATPTELGDYYLRDGERVEAPGRWVNGADAIGVDQAMAVSGEQLRALMAVIRPDTGQPLRRIGANGEAVAAIDATFSAPKSVSAVWALSSPELRERIERAHEHAIDRALIYATEHVSMIRERVDSQTVIRLRPSGLIATSWRHTTARAVDGLSPDPQLHSHVLLHGAVSGDGRVVAIDSRAWLVHGRELGAAYRTELARELAAMGFGIERGTGRGGRYFEIAGVPRALLDRWSSRHHQVRAAITARLREHHAELARAVEAGDATARAATARLRSGQLSPREDRYLTTATRARKQHLATRSDLDRHWRTTAQALRFDSSSVERLREPGRSITPADDRELLRRLTEFDATFSERKARAVALEASTGVGIERSPTPLAQLRQQRRVVSLADGTLTPSEHRGTERETVQAAQRLATMRVSPIPERLVADHAATLDAELKARSGSLSLEQREALALACTDGPLVLIEGQAGTGRARSWRRLPKPTRRTSGRSS
ncbi:MAG: relaxase domain-containing protein [Actinomycetota bacterium]|nr:relaxase domain-containing protein [Actinomycetota bacterium]